MSIGNTPAVFVSSTFYDLRQIRANLKEFIEEFGMQPVMSEFDAFPIDPDKTTEENCLKVVDENADILVLLVGARYGVISDTKKSITNMEYLRAKSKGIPVYVFVEQRILTVLPIWKENPEIDWKSTVDTPELFKFVDSLLGEKGQGVWVTPFSSSDDIVSSLRKQFSYLFKEGLNLRLRFRGRHMHPVLAALKGESLRLVINQPPLWEYLLFNEVLREGMEQAREHQLDREYGVVLGTGTRINDFRELARWAGQKMEEALRIVDVFVKVMNKILPDGLKPAGTSSDPVLLVYAARRLALSYQTALDWTLETQRLYVVNEDWHELVRLSGTFLDRTISDFNGLADYLQSTLAELVELQRQGGWGDEEKQLNYHITFEVTNIEAFNEEFDRLRRVNLQNQFD